MPTHNIKYLCESQSNTLSVGQTNDGQHHPFIRPRACQITYVSRNCQRCRYNKCIEIGMDINIKSSEILKNTILSKNSSSKQLSIDCVICNMPSNGIHFGVVSCEGCKGFFRRSQFQNKYDTYFCNSLRINNGQSDCHLRCFNSCRFCRYKKCISVGMSYECSKVGRRSNLVKRELLNSSSSTKREYSMTGSDIGCGQFGVNRDEHLAKRPRLTGHKLSAINETNVRPMEHGQVSNSSNYFVPNDSYGFKYNIASDFRGLGRERYDMSMMINNVSSVANKLPVCHASQQVSVWTMPGAVDWIEKSFQQYYRN